jgi:excisionase family DNA binding protein
MCIPIAFFIGTVVWNDLIARSAFHSHNATCRGFKSQVNTLERIEVMQTSVTRKAWSPREVAETTGTSLSFIRKEIRNGGILAVNAGRRLLVSNDELDRYIAEGSRKQEGGAN